MGLGSSNKIPVPSTLSLSLLTISARDLRESVQESAKNISRQAHQLCRSGCDAYECIGVDVCPRAGRIATGCIIFQCKLVHM